MKCNTTRPAGRPRRSEIQVISRSMAMLVRSGRFAHSACGAHAGGTSVRGDFGFMILHARQTPGCQMSVFDDEASDFSWRGLYSIRTLRASSTPIFAAL